MRWIACRWRRPETHASHRRWPACRHAARAEVSRRGFGLLLPKATRSREQRPDLVQWQTGTRVAAAADDGVGAEEAVEDRLLGRFDRRLKHGVDRAGAIAP